MSDAESPKPPDLGHIEEINNLDTARMALRWALERLDALQKDKLELASRVEHLDEEGQRLKKDNEFLQKTISLRSQEADERELYYKRMEEFISSSLAGKVDFKTLIEREAETERLRAFLQNRQERLEKEDASRREVLEKQYRELKFRLEEEAQSRVRRAEEAAEDRRKNLDAAYLARMAELHDSEIRMKARGEALEERERRFEEFHRAARAKLDAEIKNFHEEVEAQAEFKARTSEQFTGWRHGILEDSWRIEKAKLLQEVADWRHRSEEMLARTLELEKTVYNQNESGRRREQEIEALRGQWEKRLTAAEDDKRALAEQIEFWRKRAQAAPTEANAKLQEWQKRHQEEVRALEASVALRVSDLEEEIYRRVREWEERQETFRNKERLGNDRLRRQEREIDEAHRQVELLRDSLLKAIEDYKRRGSGEQP